MTPVFMNPSSSPFSPDLVEQKDQSDRQHHLKFFLSPYNEEGSSSLSPSPTFFNSNVNQDQSSDVFQSNDEQLDQKDDNGSGKDGNSMINSGGGSVKYWMSSKMRLIQKMCNPEAPATTIVSTSTTGSDHKGAEKTAHKVLTTSPRKHKTQFTFNFCHGNNNNNSNNTGGVVRVCSDCNTTTTPLWRSGPRGPKSLCNACGIRRRKARRAMADAAAAAVANGIELAAADTAATINSSIKTTYNFNYKTRKYHITEEKKPSKNHKIARYKGKFKLKLVNKATGNATSSPPTKSERISNNNSKLCFGHFSTFGPNDKKFFSGVFPQDVAEAAILLMELSCHGFVHS